MSYLIYDADCGFCTNAARWAERRGVAVRAWQAIPDLAAVGLTEEMVTAAAYWVGPDGEARDAGAMAIARGLEHSGGWRRPVGRVLRMRWVRPLAALVYRWIAANRYRLPGSTEACRLPPG
ncbi:thiol-disulfide oxidoreductase DCC family protein [Nocardioides sp. R-C-SC26]|uniref:thiol-disulfide oxidoreductase DCC family protein n=1 Tax=Nocardioides sp. R-C-SC26 TaxID=2870414 RepID=UPI001E48EFE6|nr:DCC1-like thiol-disulfide oxidoreductase family protein [Nocardioides sp. R-C-SC26]